MPLMDYYSGLGLLKLEINFLMRLLAPESWYRMELILDRWRVFLFLEPAELILTLTPSLGGENTR